MPAETNKTYLTTRQVDRIGAYILLGVGAAGCIFGAQLLDIPIFYSLYVPFATAALVGLLRIFIRPRFGKFYFAPGTAVGLLEVVFGGYLDELLNQRVRQGTSVDYYLASPYGIWMFQLVGWGMIIAGIIRTVVINAALTRASTQEKAADATAPATASLQTATTKPESNAASDALPE